MKIELVAKYNPRHEKTRVFVLPESESMLDMLLSRQDRPHRKWQREVIPKVISELGLPAGTTARWSQFAGCSCPCSPGFILSENVGKNINVWVGDQQ